MPLRKPPSQKQIAANRRNALKSSGPKTLRGKAAIRFNNFRHGLRSSSPAATFPGQDPKALARLRAIYAASHRPANPVETALLEQMAFAHWTLDYWKRTETRCVEFAIQTGSVGPAYLFDRILQRQARCELSWNRALFEFHKLRAPNGHRPAPSASPISQPPKKSIT